MYTKQSYTISQEARTALQTAYRPGNYTTCYGNQLQHVIHQDCIDLLEDTVAMPLHSPLHEHTPALVELIDAAREYNQAGECSNALKVSDLCCSLLAYGQAVAQGAVQGLAGVVEYSIDHPIETAAMVIAPEAALIYQLSKVVHDVAKIGITYVYDKGESVQQAAEYLAPLTNLIDAFSKNKLTGPQVAQGVTQFAVGWIAHNKLLGGLGKLYGGVRTKAQTFFKKNPATTVREYVQTTEGQLLRVLSPETEQECEKLVQLSKQQGQKKLQNGTVPAAIKSSANGNSKIDKILIYKDSKKHPKVRRGNVSPRPKNGKKALNNSIPLGEPSTGRIAICDDEIVVLRLTQKSEDIFEYHGYVITADELIKETDLLNPLLEAGLINRKGKILKNE